MKYLNETYASDVITKMIDWKRINDELLSDAKENFDLIIEMFDAIGEIRIEFNDIKHSNGKCVLCIMRTDTYLSFSERDRKKGKALDVYSKELGVNYQTRLPLRYYLKEHIDYEMIAIILDGLIQKYPNIIKSIRTNRTSIKFDL